MRFQRCVVVQEVFPDGLIAQDGRLRPGDQIIEINGVDMTCANHLQVSTFLRQKNINQWISLGLRGITKNDVSLAVRRVPRTYRKVFGQRSWLE